MTASTEPEWVTLGWLEKKFSIKRGLAYKLIAAGKIKSTSVSSTGTRGTRLVQTKSVRRLLEDGADQINQTTKKETY